MNELYRQSIIEMIAEIKDTVWLKMIYSFIKVFAEDKEGAK